MCFGSIGDCFVKNALAARTGAACTSNSICCCSIVFFQLHPRRAAGASGGRALPADEEHVDAHVAHACRGETLHRAPNTNHFPNWLDMHSTSVFVVWFSFTLILLCVVDVARKQTEEKVG